ncbi:MAG: type II secretion system major pseudopilin GspG [Gemmatimonadota bacterium]|jgi:general secretion pathway protein G
MNRTDLRLRCVQLSTVTPSLRRPGSRAGLTLIEIMVVIIILGLLAGLVAPRILGRVSEARGETARTQLELIRVALDNYYLDNGRYPTTTQGLEALRTEPTSEPRPRNWRGPYLRGPVPQDPWGRDYIYRSPGSDNPTSFDLVTLGADGELGGEGEDADLSV